MSGPEDFLRRWSRRKRAATAARAAPKPEAPAAVSPAETIAPAPGTTTEPAAPAVDLDSLPSIDSITGETDVSGFLAPGVPSALTRAALRRAWQADPAIRDFVGIAENQWDFTAPGGAPGFGALADEEVQRLVAGVFGDPEPAPPGGEEVPAPAQISSVEPAPAARSPIELDAVPPSGEVEQRAASTPNNLVKKS